jgi:methylated-DNA-[protein]-cysteine S-methyltransferase
MELQTDEIPSVIGRIILVATDEALCALDFADCRERMFALLEGRYGDIQLRTVKDPHGCSSAVRAYLDGDLCALDSIPVDTSGTAFQRRVWSALREIPVGSTMSYGGLAARIGQPAAARAVGMSNSRNPVALVVPCHRVIGAGGALTGYAGGMERKRWLLRHEGVGV